MSTRDCCWLPMALGLAGCRAAPTTEQAMTEPERSAIADSAIAVMRGGLDDVHRLDATAFTARYAESSATRTLRRKSAGWRGSHASARSSRASPTTRAR